MALGTSLYPHVTIRNKNFILMEETPRDAQDLHKPLLGGGGLITE